LTIVSWTLHVNPVRQSQLIDSTAARGLKSRTLRLPSDHFGLVPPAIWQPDLGPEKPDRKLSTSAKVIPRTFRTPSSRFKDASAVMSGRLRPGARTESRLTHWFSKIFQPRKSWTI